MDIQAILKAHLLYIQGDEKGVKADLRDADLRDANLRGADLRGANLRDANLRCADLRDANLRGADLREANLRGADLRDANLRGADLRGAYLWGANLRGANLRGANLRDADLRDANLRGADLRGAYLWGANLRCADLRGADLWDANLWDADLRGADLSAYKIVPEEGAFIGWKKLSGGVICKLLIPEGAARTSSLIGRKCRAEYAQVLWLSEQGTFTDYHSKSLTYEVGNTVTADKYNDDIRIECTNGIHFFLTREEAENYR